MYIYFVVLYFFIYGFLGWCTEVAYAAVKEGKFVNRGFLNGPICPIYGIGVSTVIHFLQPVADQWILLYILSTILVTLLEGATGFLLEKLFHHRWWDYSEIPLNIGGYVFQPLDRWYKSPLNNGTYTVEGYTLRITKLNTCSNVYYICNTSSRCKFR